MSRSWAQAERAWRLAYAALNRVAISGAAPLYYTRERYNIPAGRRHVCSHDPLVNEEWLHDR
jgi:hypothetical protein